MNDSDSLELKDVAVNGLNILIRKFRFAIANLCSLWQGDSSFAFAAIVEFGIEQLIRNDKRRFSSHQRLGHRTLMVETKSESGDSSTVSRNGRNAEDIIRDGTQSG